MTICNEAEECPTLITVPEEGLVIVTSPLPTVPTNVETEILEPKVIDSEATTELAYTGVETGFWIWFGIMAVCIGQFMKKVGDNGNK